MKKLVNTSFQIDARVRNEFRAAVALVGGKQGEVVSRLLGHWAADVLRNNGRVQMPPPLSAESFFTPAVERVNVPNGHDDAEPLVEAVEPSPRAD